MIELDYASIGNRIRQVRIAKSISQRALAERANINQANLSHIENGSAKFSLPTLISIANALSVGTDEILCDNLECSRAVLHGKIADLVSDLSPSELVVFERTFRAFKSALRNSNE